MTAQNSVSLRLESMSSAKDSRKVGDHCAVHWGGSAVAWKADIIRADDRLQTYDVIYDDGTKDLSVPASAVKDKHLGKDGENASQCRICRNNNIPPSIYNYKSTQNVPEAILCDLCSVEVHAFCYGLPRELGEEDPDFYCQRCRGDEPFISEGRRGLLKTRETAAIKFKGDKDKIADKAEAFSTDFYAKNKDKYDCLLCSQKGHADGGAFVAVPKEVSDAIGDARPGGHWVHLLCAIRQPGLWVDWRCKKALLLENRFGRPATPVTPAASRDEKAFGKYEEWGGGTVRGWGYPENYIGASIQCDICKQAMGCTIGCCIGTHRALGVFAISSSAVGARGARYAQRGWESPDLEPAGQVTSMEHISKDHGIGHYGIPVQMVYYSCRDVSHAPCAVPGRRTEAVECHWAFHAACGRAAGLKDSFAFEDLSRWPMPDSSSGSSSAASVTLTPVQGGMCCETHTRKHNVMVVVKRSRDRDPAHVFSISEALKRFVLDRSVPHPMKELKDLPANAWWYSILGSEPGSGGSSGSGSGSSAPTLRVGTVVVPSDATSIGVAEDSAMALEAAREALQAAKENALAKQRLQAKKLLPLPLDLARWLPVNVVIHLMTASAVSGSSKGASAARSAAGDLPAALVEERDAWITAAKENTTLIVRALFILDAMEQRLDQQLEKKLSEAGGGGSKGGEAKRAKVEKSAGTGSTGSSGTPAADRVAQTDTFYREFPTILAESDRQFHTADKLAREAAVLYSSADRTKSSAEKAQADEKRSVAEKARAEAEATVTDVLTMLKTIRHSWMKRIDDLEGRLRENGVEPWPSTVCAHNVRSLTVLMRASLMRGLGWDWPGCVYPVPIPLAVEERVRQTAVDTAVSTIGYIDAYLDASSESHAAVKSMGDVVVRAHKERAPGAGSTLGTAPAPPPVTVLILQNTLLNPDTQPARTVRHVVLTALQRPELAALLIPGAQAPSASSAASSGASSYSTMAEEIVGLRRSLRGGKGLDEAEAGLVQGYLSTLAKLPATYGQASGSAGAGSGGAGSGATTVPHLPAWKFIKFLFAHLEQASADGSASQQLVADLAAYFQGEGRGGQPSAGAGGSAGAGAGSKRKA